MASISLPLPQFLSHLCEWGATKGRPTSHPWVKSGHTCPGPISITLRRGTGESEFLGASTVMHSYTGVGVREKPKAITNHRLPQSIRCRWWWLWNSGQSIWVCVWVCLRERKRALSKNRKGKWFFWAKQFNAWSWLTFDYYYHYSDPPWKERKWLSRAKRELPFHFWMKSRIGFIGSWDWCVRMWAEYWWWWINTHRL